MKSSRIRELLGCTVESPINKETGLVIGAISDQYYMMPISVNKKSIPNKCFHRTGTGLIDQGKFSCTRIVYPYPPLQCTVFPIIPANNDLKACKINSISLYPEFNGKAITCIPVKCSGCCNIYSHVDSIKRLGIFYDTRNRDWTRIGASTGIRGHIVLKWFRGIIKMPIRNHGFRTFLSK